jgi:hypothetical protein
LFLNVGSQRPRGRSQTWAIAHGHAPDYAGSIAATPAREQGRQQSRKVSSA